MATNGMRSTEGGYTIVSIVSVKVSITHSPFQSRVISPRIIVRDTSEL